MTQLIEPKILKGTRDFLPEDMAKRNLVMDKIKRVFERFGYDTIETPVLNYAEVILGKYGEEGDRLTYAFEDRGGRRIALPYDLTVPFARLFSANYSRLPIPFKRYQIQRVWRAERPQKGRLREFYQCDIDIIGTQNLIAEAEIAKVMFDIFQELGFEKFVIQINSRRLMNGILKFFKIESKAQEIIRVIDKIDKIGQEEVQKELSKLGLEKETIESLINFLTADATNESTLEKLKSFDTAEIEEFLKLCAEFKIPEKYIKFNPSLARGLDYYTGIVYEVKSEEVNLGSLCGGGRYDNLCGLFCKEKFSGVGVAFGFERIMIALEELKKLSDVRLNARVLVTLFNGAKSRDVLSIYTTLLGAGINSEIYLQPDALSKQFKYADKKGIPFVVIQGPEEIEQDAVTVKMMKNGKQKTLPVNQLISYLKGYE